MKIEQFRIDGFGRLSGLETGALEDLVVVLGPNEAGKSTLFHFLTTALYGFQPASRERNPHVPWEADEAGGIVQVRLSDDRCAVIERRLRSAPSGRLRISGEESDLRNQPVPWVRHVPRAVFRQVFAITLAELAGLDSETWLRIQDRVMGSMGASDLRGARAVADQLEQEAGEIWRPSRRGNQRLRDLRGEIRRLRSERSAALERDQHIRGLVEERDNEIVAVREARAERQRHKAALETTTALLPMRRRLERVDTLRAQGGDRNELRRLDEQIVDSVTRLRTEVDRTNAEVATIQTEVDALAALATAALETDTGILEAEQEIVRALSRASAMATEEDSLAQLVAEANEVAGRLNALWSQTLDGEPNPDADSALERLSPSLLEDRIARLEDARGTEPHRPTPVQSGKAQSLLAASALSIGVGLLAWGAVGASPVLAAVGGALAALGITVALLFRTTSPPGGASPPLESVEEGVSELLRDLPIRAEWRAAPSRALARDLGRIQELTRARRDAESRIRSLREMRGAVDAEATALAARLGVSVPSDPKSTPDALRSALKSAEERRAEARAAERELGRVKASLDRATLRAKEADGELAEIVGRVFELTGATDLDAVSLVQARVAAHAEADRIEAELLHEHPKLDEVRAEILAAEQAGVEWSRSAEEIAGLRARIEELDERIEEGVARAEALETEVHHLKRLDTVDVVESALLEAADVESRLAEERDRKWVLAQLIREADRRFRDEHQPDVVRRASDHLRTLTNGRYRGLLIEEVRGRAVFQLVGPGLPKPIPLAYPISTGTIEQAYLSLRLAIVDHLDEGSEKLPLFVDEAFVNWDAGRRDRGLDTLSRLSKTRQVFAFTCHPAMAERLGAQGARVLELER